jgi:hypothetical protein
MKDNTPPPLPPLPAIATAYLQADKVDHYSFALCDILCWLQGYQAGGGIYGPDSIQALRDLNDALKAIQSEQTK